MRFSMHLGGVLAALLVACAPSWAGDRKATHGSHIQPELLYHNYCSVCHGDRGDGNSRASTSFNPPPRDFTKSDLPRDYMMAIVRDGKAGTAMAGWGTQLNHKEIEALVDYVRSTFMRVSTDPQIKRGKEIYAKTCTICHGEHGEGTIYPQAGVTRPPRDLTTPQARAELTRSQLVEAITNGRSGTAMLSFKSQLPKKDIDAVAAYIEAVLMLPIAQVSGTMHGRQSAPGQGLAQTAQADMTLPFPSGLKGDVAKGKAFYNKNCATCHGEKGNGQGPRAYFINPKPVNFLSDKSRATLNRPTLFTIVAAGKQGTEMPAWRHVLTDQEMANVAEYVFRSFIHPGQTSTARAK